MIDLDEAIDFMIEKHRGQYRKGGMRIPYVTHTMEVMKAVSRFMEYSNEDRLLLGPSEMLIAALWYDLLEDTDCTEEEILERTNERVLQVVQECSRPEDGGKDFGTKYEWLQGFREKSLASVVIKIADRYHNVDDYLFEPKKKAYAARYALQAYPIYRIYLLNGKNSLVMDYIKSLASIAAVRYGINIIDTEIEHEVGIICRHRQQQDPIEVQHHSV